MNRESTRVNKDGGRESKENLILRLGYIRLEIEYLRAKEYEIIQQIIAQDLGEGECSEEEEDLPDERSFHQNSGGENSFQESSTILAGPNYTWVPTSVYGAMPPNAVFAGTDSDSSPIYVGRTFHEGDQLPAKVIPSKQAAYVSHNGNEIVKHHVEVLVGTGFTWVHSGNGHVPPNAVKAGQTVHGHPLYVGRTHHEGSLTPGKIHPSHGCLYFPYGGAEQSSLHYEVLCGQPASRWAPTSAHAGVPPDAVLAGHDSDGAPIYVGRAFHEGDQLPAKVIPSKQVAYVSHNGQEVSKHHFEVFCHTSVSWVSSGHGSVPPNAVRAGNTSSGEPLYVGRTFYQGSLTPGKIHPSHGSLYIPYGGAEIPFKNYEVLIEN